MTETTRRRITIAAKVVRAVALTMTLAVLVAAAAVAAVSYLIPRERAAAERKALGTLRTTWAAVLVTTRALRTW